MEDFIELNRGFAPYNPGQAGEHDDLHLGERIAGDDSELKTVERPEPDIGQHRIELLRPQRLPRSFEGRVRDDVPPRLGKPSFKCCDQRRVVVNDQQAQRLIIHFPNGITETDKSDAVTRRASDYMFVPTLAPDAAWEVSIRGKSL